MRIVISSDEYSQLIDLVIDEVKQREHEALYFGPAKDGQPLDWPEVTLQAAEQIHRGEADEGIVLCWTGTGCALIANKLPGIYAALCTDAETAKGARIWNHANVLALSLRLTSAPILKEILKAWFETPHSTDEWNLLQMKRVKQVEKSTQSQSQSRAAGQPLLEEKT